MQQDEHEEESAEEEPQEEPAEEPAEELAEAAVSAELKDPASMTPYGCPPGLPKMLGIVRLRADGQGPTWSQHFSRPGSRAFCKTKDPRSSPCTTMLLGIIW